MNAYKALAVGFRRTLSVQGIVFWLYVANLLLAVPYAFGLRATLQAALGSSLAPGLLTKDFDLTVVADFLHHHGAEFVAAARPVWGLLLLSLVVSIFCTGGVLTAVRDKRYGISSADFFSACAKYFGKFLRLTLIVAFFALLVTFLFSLAAEAALDVWIAHADSEIPGTLALAIRALYLLLLFGVATMVLDYARIDAVVNGLPSMRRSAWKGLRFVYHRLGRSVKLQFFLTLFFLVLLGAYLLLEYWCGSTSPGSIVAVIVLQQLFIFGRAGLRVFGFASESVLYQELSPPGGGIPGWDFGHGWE